MSHLSRRTALKLGAAWAISPALLAGSTAAQETGPYADAKFVAGGPPKIADESFSVIVLPDTQHYCERFPDTYHAQTKWIVDQKKDRNIACVLHLGDITNRNTKPQWEVAQKAMTTLDDQLPYFFVCGNHDYSDGGGCKDRTTMLNDYFPLTRFRERPTFGGVYDKEPERMENSYHLFSAGGRNFIVIALEFGPRADVVRWAGEVAAKHKDRAAILITHAYMFSDETRYDWKQFGKKQTWNPHDYAIAKNTADDVCDGEELWQKLIAPNENFVLTLNGHVLNDGLARLESKSPGGRDVHQVLVNFQMKPNGGDGWLRCLEFKSDGKTVDAIDYSPTRNQCNASEQNKFTVRLGVG